LKSQVLADFPSGSSINYHNSRFYLIGDDATNILVLDSHYQKTDSIHLFEYSEKRIPKTEKTDLEGSTVLEIDGLHYLLIVGSASRKNRKRIILIPFSDKGLNLTSLKKSFYKTKTFIKRIGSQNIEEVNLEGVCLLKGNLILGNRGNRSNQSNHLIFTDPGFWDHQDDAKLVIKKLSVLPGYATEILGLSELCYIEQMDLLLVTLTSEATDDAFNDGAIGNSYLGWISEASLKIQEEELVIDGMIKLLDVNPVFKNEKIEGLCVERIDGPEVFVHLISDNDCGESRLFSIKMTIN
jgi:hypothetical protein